MKSLHMITFILLVIGGLNWLLIGINPSWDLVAMIFGPMSTLSRIVYILVGLSAVVEIAGHKSNCKNCSTTGSM